MAWKTRSLFEDTVISQAEEKVINEIRDLDNFPLSELQQRLVNYLIANVPDIVEALGLEDPIDE